MGERLSVIAYQEGRLTYLWLIVLLFLFTPYWLYVWGPLKK